MENNLQRETDNHLKPSKKTVYIRQKTVIHNLPKVQLLCQSALTMIFPLSIYDGVKRNMQFDLMVIQYIHLGNNEIVRFLHNSITIKVSDLKWSYHMIFLPNDSILTI